MPGGFWKRRFDGVWACAALPAPAAAATVIAAATKSRRDATGSSAVRGAAVVRSVVMICSFVDKCTGEMAVKRSSNGAAAKSANVRSAMQADRLRISLAAKSDEPCGKRESADWQLLENSRLAAPS